MAPPLRRSGPAAATSSVPPLMSSVSIEPFQDGHLAGAAEELAARHERHRSAVPLLAPGDSRAALEGLWRKKGVSGAVALRDRKVAAFVLAEVGERARFGRSAWVPHAGHATGDDELLRDTYAAAAQVWVEAGTELHYAMVPATVEALEPWYRLGFAHMHVEGLYRGGAQEAPTAAGVTLRLGTRRDLKDGEALDLEIYRLQARSPSFARLALERAAHRAQWSEIDLDEEGLRYVVAEDQGIVVGHSLIYRAEPILGYPADAACLASTVVREDLRRRGIGGALLAEMLRVAEDAGYGSLVTNWRMTNLVASRFWPAHGFRPTYYRLHRTIGSG